MKKPESRLVSDVRTRLSDEIGGRWLKVHGGPFQEAGVSDLVGCVFGYYVAIEVKTPQDRRPDNPLQVKWIDDIRANGGCAFITYSASAACRRVKAFLLSHDRDGSIHEALEARSVSVSTSGCRARRKAEVIRVVDGPRNGEDHRLSESDRRPVAKELTAPGVSRRP